MAVKKIIIEKFLKLLYNNFGKNRLASPKNRKNPNTSVAVVRNTDDERAGSSFSFSNNIGIASPKNPCHRYRRLLTILPIIVGKNTKKAREIFLLFTYLTCTLGRYPQRYFFVNNFMC